MDLEVVLLGSSLPLERCLRQIGVPYRVVDPKGSVPQNSAAYFVSADLEYCRKSAALLLRNNRAVIVPESMMHRAEATPLLFAYPDDCLDAASGTVPKIFKVGGISAKEEVAVRSTNSSVRFFFRFLAQIFEKQGLLFPAVSLYPFGYRTLFSFRVDADEYDAGVCAAFFEKATRHSTGTTVFFSAANFLRAVPLIQSCASSGFEVFSHAFYHHTYSSYRQNLCNIRKAASFFDSLRVSRLGFAAPHGRWNQGLQRALEESGYGFSSDFSYDYDNYPSFPLSRSGFSTVLQIPIHPVCSGICLEALKGPLSHADLAAYFESIFEKKYLSGEPIIFYEHPTAWTVKEFALIDQWFSRARNASDVWICQLGEFAGWCMGRDRLRLKVSQEPHSSRIDIDCGDMSASKGVYALNLYRKGSEEYAQVRLSGAVSSHESTGLRFHERALGEEKEKERVPLPGMDLLKRLVKRSLDWETVTPLSELVVEDLGTAVKKVARFFRGISSSRASGGSQR
jgi:hypothetical protein